MMLTKTRRLALAAAVVCIGLGGGGAGAGGIALTTPAGLSPGDTFRFVFVTDGGIEATSTNIADYNTFVNAQAGGATYNGSVINWFAIASTPSTDAINNVGVTNAPVYLANGTPIASTDGATGLWSGSLLNPIDEDLTVIIAEDPWTGTTPSGVGEPGHQPGTSSAAIGSTTFADSRWVFVFNFPTNIGDPLSLYGISQALTVTGSSVPEPSTLLLAATAISAGCAFGWSRRRRDERRQRTVEQRGTPD
jgi:PEP-CTERM motif